MNSLALQPHVTHSRPDTAPRVHEPYPDDWIERARLLAEEFREGAIARDRTSRLPVEQVRRLRESGIVNLLYPKALGGGGGSIRDAAWSVLEIARADGSLGALLAFHFYNSLIPLLLDYDGRNHQVVRQSVEERWQWGNVTQYVNSAFIAEHHPDGGFTISGTKKWNTGAPLAEITTLLFIHPDNTHFLYAHIPTDREGLTFHDDWDQLGLRGADSSAISFDRLRIYSEDILHWGHGAAQTGPVPLWTTFGAVFYSAVFLGSALGALDTARAYATSDKRQSTLPGAKVTADDVLVQAQFAEPWLKVQAGLAYFESQIATLQSGWDRRAELSEDDRGRLAVETLALRSFTSKVALEVTPEIFEFGGGRATNAANDFDRFWRDVRTLASHDPAILAQRTIGAYALTGATPRFPSKFAAKPADAQGAER
jgi:alkylation response protein AidB-like acyl-CoA dehydrogenase